MKMIFQFGSFYVDEEEFFLEPTQRYCTDTSINSTFRVWKVNLSGLQFSDVTGTLRMPLCLEKNSTISIIPQIYPLMDIFLG